MIRVIFFHPLKTLERKDESTSFLVSISRWMNKRENKIEKKNARINERTSITDHRVYLALKDVRNNFKQEPRIELTASNIVTTNYQGSSIMNFLSIFLPSLTNFFNMISP